MTQPRYSLMSEAYLSIYEGKRGLWDNIHAKRKRGEAPARPGDEDYPKTLNVEATGDVTGHGPRLDTAYHYDMEDDGIKSGEIKNRRIKSGKKKKFRIEGLEQARKNVGADTCWDGYKAKGTKMKGGKSVPNCVKEDYIEYLLDNGFAEDLNSAEIIYNHMSDDWKMVIDEEAYDKMKDMRQERGGVDGNTNYDKPPKPNKNMGGGKPQAGPDAALKAVKKMMKGKLM